jgi:cytochrome c oxidase cbb3-type subunit 3
MKAALPLLALATLLASCQREDREYRANPVTAESQEKIALSPLSAGPSPPVEGAHRHGQELRGERVHVAQGKKLYIWFNCNGCHANGGGGSGPPLMDDRWTYGGQIENVVQTIREGGRTACPPSAADSRRPDLADRSYVRSMGRNVSKDVAPGATTTCTPLRPSCAARPGAWSMGAKYRRPPRCRNEAAMKRIAPVLLLALPLAGCQGWQSALDAHGPAARTLADMFWIFTAVLGTVWVLTMGALLWRFASAASPERTRSPRTPPPSGA